MNLIIGSHVGFKKNEQLLGSVHETISYNGNTFMIYTGAPQNTARANIDANITKKALELMQQNNIDINNVIVHAPYIINPASDKNIDFCISFLKQEINRANLLGIKKLVLHPGSHVGLGVKQGIQNTINVLNNVLDENQEIIICIETMAGKGTEIGTTFEEIKEIIDGVKLKDKVMVCIDTCHINDAGYDLNNFDEILKKFDEIIGINKIGCIHINDSKNLKGTHKDRHENIGYGTIGFENLINIIYHPLLVNIPKILETPYIDDGDKKYPPYKDEINMIKNKKFKEIKKI